MGFWGTILKGVKQALEEVRREKQIRKAQENKKEVKIDDYPSLIAFWHYMKGEVAGTPLEESMTTLYRFVKEHEEPRDIAQAFFSYGVGWAKKEGQEELFREGWKSILDPYKQEGKIIFSWENLGKISLFLVGSLTQISSQQQDEKTGKTQENKKGVKIEDYPSLIAFWHYVKGEVAGNFVEDAVTILYRFVKEHEEPRDIAQAFFSYNIRWAKKEGQEAAFREGWKNILRPYQQGEKIVFSWENLGKISLFLVGFLTHLSSKREENKRWGKRPWYEVLGVLEISSWEEIRKAYRHLMMIYHPDHCASLREAERLVAEEKSKEINEAFEYVKHLRGIV